MRSPCWSSRLRCRSRCPWRVIIVAAGHRAEKHATRGFVFVCAPGRTRPLHDSVRLLSDRPPGLVFHHVVALAEVREVGERRWAAASIVVRMVDVAAACGRGAAGKPAGDVAPDQRTSLSRRWSVMIDVFDDARLRSVEEPFPARHASRDVPRSGRGDEPALVDPADAVARIDDLIDQRLFRSRAARGLWGRTSGSNR